MGALQWKSWGKPPKTAVLQPGCWREVVGGQRYDWVPVMEHFRRGGACEKGGPASLTAEWAGVLKFVAAESALFGSACASPS